MLAMRLAKHWLIGFSRANNLRYKEMSMENLAYVLLVLSVLAGLGFVKPELLEKSSFRFLSGFVIGSTFVGAIIMLINSLL